MSQLCHLGGKQLNSHSMMINRLKLYKTKLRMNRFLKKWLKRDKQTKPSMTKSKTKLKMKRKKSLLRRKLLKMKRR